MDDRKFVNGHWETDEEMYDRWEKEWEARMRLVNRMDLCMNEGLTFDEIRPPLPEKYREEYDKNKKLFEELKKKDFSEEERLMDFSEFKKLVEEYLGEDYYRYTDEERAVFVEANLYILRRRYLLGLLAYRKSGDMDDIHWELGRTVEDLKFIIDRWFLDHPTCRE